MQLLLFGIVYPFAWLFSRLPMRILYIISDILFFFIYHVFGYRKTVVLKNLSYAFPEKTLTEKQQLSKEFFKHFTDILMESVKGFSMGEKEILRRYTYKNPELLNSFVQDGKSIVLVGAHLANWEWSVNLPFFTNIPIFASYKELQNPYFEKALKKSRERFDMIVIKTFETVKIMMSNYQKEQQGLYILLSDQSPTVEKTLHWTPFFDIKVPVHTGMEMLSKKFDLVVINYHSKKIKRGYYETEFELITENPKDFKNYELTDKYINITERNIKNSPENYLWSHNRFKHKDRFDEWLNNYSSKKTKR